jgi:hypothetical protein
MPFQSVQGGIVIAHPASGTVAELAGLPSKIRRPSAAISDPFDRSKLYAATNDSLGAIQVYRVDLAAGSATGVAPLLPSPLLEIEAVGLASIGEELLLLTRFALHRLPKQGGAPQLVIPLPAPAGGRALATDGRRLFASVTTREIYRVDLVGAPAVGQFATLPGSLGAIQDLALDARGDLLVADADPFAGSYVRLYDDLTGLEMQSYRVPLEPPLALAHDPLLDQEYVSGFAQGQSWIVVLRAGREVARLGPLPHLGGSLDLVRTAPLYLTGSGCPSALGTVPGYDASGLPALGNPSYGLHVFQAPSGPALLLLGARAPFGRGFAFPLGPEAPGCALEVLPDLILPALVPASGEATILFAVPNEPALAGGIVDTQWWLTDPGANALGLAASQRGTVIIE